MSGSPRSAILAPRIGRSMASSIPKQCASPARPAPSLPQGLRLHQHREQAMPPLHHLHGRCGWLRSTPRSPRGSAAIFSRESARKCRGQRQLFAAFPQPSRPAGPLQSPKPCDKFRRQHPRAQHPARLRSQWLERQRLPRNRRSAPRNSGRAPQCGATIRSDGSSPTGHADRYRVLMMAEKSSPPFPSAANCS